METDFAAFVLLTGMCYDTETNVILLHLNSAFAWYAFCKVLERSPFHQNFNKPKAIVQGFFLGVRKKVLRKVIHLKVNEKRN